MTMEVDQVSMVKLMDKNIPPADLVENNRCMLTQALYKFSNDQIEQERTRKRGRSRYEVSCSVAKRNLLANCLIRILVLSVECCGILYEFTLDSLS